PVVLVGPVAAHVLQVRQRDALGPVVDDLGVRPAGGVEASAEIVEDGVGDVDAERSDGVVHGRAPYRTAPPRSGGCQPAASTLTCWFDASHSRPSGSTANVVAPPGSAGTWSAGWIAPPPSTSRARSAPASKNTSRPEVSMTI